MAAQALYRRWRPQRFEDVVGQDAITRTLANAVATDRLAHAYLFTGLRGTGKTSVARILAKAVNCVGEGTRPCNACDRCAAITEGRSLDLIEIDAASNTGVDDVRDLREKIGFAPAESRFKVYIVDEAHMLSTAAFNALLKTLEEPPAHALFVLATTEPHKIPDTITSRCQRHDFRRVGVAEVAAKLRRICDAEGVEAEDAALERLARAGTGSLRDAESLLDQVVATGDAVTLARVRDVLGMPGAEAVVGLVDAVLERDAAAALERLGETTDRGVDPAQLQARLLEHLRQLLLVQTGVDESLLDAPEEQLEDLRRQAAAWPTVALVAAIHRVSEARPSPDGAQPSLPLELALVESVLDGEEAASPVARAEATSAAPARERPSSPPAETRRAKTRSTSPAAPATATPAGPTPEDPARDAPSAPARTPAVAETATPAAATRPISAPDADDDPGAGAPADEAPDAAAAAASPAPTHATPSPADLGRLRDGWERVVAAVARRDKNTAALLKDCRPVSVEGDDVVLGFFYDFHCKRASEGPRKAAIAQAVADLLGRPPSLRLTVVPQSGDDRATRPRSKTERAGGDPVVKHAVDELGARIAGVRADPEDGA